MAQSQAQTTLTPPQKPTISQRLLRAMSLVGTSRLACLHLSDQADSEFFDVSETLEMVEYMIGEIAEELEKKE